MSSTGGRPRAISGGRLTRVCVAFGLLFTSQALAEQGEPDERGARRIVDAERRRVDQGGYGHVFGTLALGRGLRTNNPYRLQQVLGNKPEGLSLSALYFDLGTGYLLGNPWQVEHGPAANLSVALTGIRQEVLTPGYRVLKRFDSRWSASARLGVPVVLEPDLGGGVELGLASIFHLLGGVAVYAELIGSAFFGAATYQADTTIIPIVSLQIGLFIDYEVLP